MYVTLSQAASRLSTKRIFLFFALRRTNTTKRVVLFFATRCCCIYYLFALFHVNYFDYFLDVRVFFSLSLTCADFFFRRRKVVKCERNCRKRAPLVGDLKNSSRRGTCAIRTSRRRRLLQAFKSNTK